MQHQAAVATSRPALSKELQAELQSQVEFYFSDDNLANDTFLRKHISKGDDGFVSIALIHTFNRLQALTDDWHVVSDALRDAPNRWSPDSILVLSIGKWAAEANLTLRDAGGVADGACRRRHESQEAPPVLAASAHVAGATACVHDDFIWQSRM